MAGNVNELHQLLDADEVRHVLKETFYSGTAASVEVVDAETDARFARTTQGHPSRDAKQALSASEHAARQNASAGRKRMRRALPKPDHYDVICISLYSEDLVELDAKVEALKAHGHRRVSRSSLIRLALKHLDVDNLPRD